MELLIKRVPNLLYKVGTVKGSKFFQQTITNHFHSSQYVSQNKPEMKESEISAAFAPPEKKGKETFLEVIYAFTGKTTLRRGHAEFILKAMTYMEEFGVHKDLECYKALMNVFPKGWFVTRNRYHKMLYPYPHQTEAAVKLLSKMEKNKVLPDYEMQEIIVNIFGEYNWVTRKLWQMTYWFLKFSQLNPWPLPKDALLMEPKDLAKYAIQKLASKDVLSVVTEIQTKDIPDSVEDTWVTSTMSKTQRELLAIQPIDQPLFVEGPFTVYMGCSSMDYFVLRGNPIQRDVVNETGDDVSNLQIPFWERLNNRMPVTLHEQDEGVYYAMCITGTSSKDSLVSWIRHLQTNNPILNRIPVVFKLRTKTSVLPLIKEGEKTNQPIKLDAPTGAS